jgi:hypothetical protein
MCVCIHCHYVDRCLTYHAVETQHEQRHLTEIPDFEPVEPSINVNIREQLDFIEVEWDVVSCLSFSEEKGKWAALRPGELLPT